MRILWHSNAPWATTGYGNQTRTFAPRIKDAGYDVAISAFYGLEGNMIGWRGMPVLPGVSQSFGNEYIHGHAKTHFDGDLRGGLTFTLMDVWVLNIEIMNKLNVASWTPVDHDPLPPAIKAYFDDAQAVPIAMSKFGMERLEPWDPIYVPHGVETDVFTPMPRKEARRLAGLPQDAFTVGLVAANQGSPSRKSFPQALRAFAAFHDRHPEAILCLHTEVTGVAQGIDLRQLLAQLRLEDAVVVSDQYRYQFLPRQAPDLAAMYSSFDVLLNPSMGEGFGIPILEAQACGTPAIVTDFSAMPEVCGAGWQVPYNPVYTGQGSYMADPLVENIVESLEACYRLTRKDRETMAARAREHALQYDADRVAAEYMVPALEELNERFGIDTPLEALVE